MFARALVPLLACALGSCAVQLQKTPRQIERPAALIDSAGPAFDAACDDMDPWDKPAPPVRIHANVYYVGTCGITALLVTGSDGHVVLDSGTEQGAELIAGNIASLGFNPRDVRYILHSHEHIDHVGGVARLQQLTGARLVASANAAPVLQSGIAGAGDPQVGLFPPFPAARVDRIIRDGEEVRLGNLVLTAHETKGHTHGALSWTWVSCDGGVCRDMVYADSLSPVSRDDYRFSDRPAVVAAFRASINRIAGLRCDILLTPHPAASNMIARMSGEAALYDPGGCRDYAAALTARLDERLARETASK